MVYTTFIMSNGAIKHHTIPRIRNISRITLKRFTCLNSSYAIDETNNTFTLTMRESPLLQPQITFHTLSIPIGFYDVYTLTTALETVLKTIESNFTVVYSTRRAQFHISCNRQFTLNSDNERVKKVLGIGEMIYTDTDNRAGYLGRIPNLINTSIYKLYIKNLRFKGLDYYPISNDEAPLAMLSFDSPLDLYIDIENESIDEIKLELRNEYDEIITSDAYWTALLEFH